MVRPALRAGAFYGPWAAVISVQMKRIEGRYSPMAYTQLAMGAVFVLIFIIPVMMWQAAAFRPDETSPELLQRINDMAWICFLNPVATVLVQGLAIGIARWIPLGVFAVWMLVMSWLLMRALKRWDIEAEEAEALGHGGSQPRVGMPA